MQKLKEYQELLATLETASKQARAIHEGGDRSGAAERTYHLLQRPIVELRQRVRSMEEIAAKDAKAKSPSRPGHKSKLPDEPCPTPTPEQLAGAGAATTGAATAEKRN